MIRGLKEDLDSLSIEKMNIQADVSELSTGSHTVQAQLELDDAFEIVSYPEITVSVTREEGESSRASESGEKETEEETRGTSERE